MLARLPRRPVLSNALAVLSTAALTLAGLTLTGCGGEEKKYVPRAAPSGRAASVPAVPTLPQKKKKDGDAYTIYGATHDLHSKVHREEVNGKKISLVGYIVKTNLVACTDDAKALDENCTPKCAVHKGGKEDPVDCKAPVPTFYIADEAGEKSVIVPVMGWASNFARIYDTIEELDKQPSVEKQKEVKSEDPILGVALPNPLPAVGMKVKVTGQYGVTYTRATSGTAANPKHGIMTYESIQILEEGSELATLPTMKPRKKK
jgi:hypothetical protein